MCAGGGGILQGAGVLEGFKLFLKYDYIKGIFAMSCLFMVEVTILDYTMKVATQGDLLDVAQTVLPNVFGAFCEHAGFPRASRGVFHCRWALTFFQSAGLPV